MAPKPPHTRRFALAFPSAFDAESWVRFWTVLADEARRMRTEGLVEFELYSCINRALSESDDYRRLLENVHKQRLAGIFFATPPFMVANTAILNQPGLPRVAITSPNSYKGVVALDMEGREQFHQRSLDLLRQHGRRRLGWFGVPGDPWEEIPARAQKADLECKPHWVQTGIQTCPGPARNLAKLLAQLPKNDRPDCLVLTDDNLVEPTIRGLLESGLRIPEDIELVASCNFPAPKCDVPVNWLGYDIRNLLTIAVDIMRRWREGGKPGESVRIPLEFEDEIRSRTNSPRSHGGTEKDLEK